jgi:uncharacterized glyoxalase superfamily protein PhnB
MRWQVTAIPKGLPYGNALSDTHNAARALEFYKRVFGAQEVARMERSPMPNSESIPQ